GHVVEPRRCAEARFASPVDMGGVSIGRPMNPPWHSDHFEVPRGCQSQRQIAASESVSPYSPAIRQATGHAEISRERSRNVGRGLPREPLKYAGSGDAGVGSNPGLRTGVPPPSRARAKTSPALQLQRAAQSTKAG